jgi:hypothetical protein
MRQCESKNLHFGMPASASNFWDTTRACPTHSLLPQAYRSSGEEPAKVTIADDPGAIHTE